MRNATSTHAEIALVLYRPIFHEIQVIFKFKRKSYSRIISVNIIKDIFLVVFLFLHAMSRILFNLSLETCLDFRTPGWDYI